MEPADVADTTALLRWAGSKRQLLPILRRYWTRDFKRYFEPFAGSASLFFALAPARAVLSDKNDGLIETYDVLRRSPARLYGAVSRFPRTKSTYERVRKLRPSALSKFGRAARFIYLNRMCFNGLYRTNLLGEFNVPFAPKKTGSLPSIDQFRACASLLERARLVCADFGTALSWAGEGDFVYIDPPYAVESRRVFRHYGPRLFSSSDLSRLSTHLRNLDSRGATFLLSYADCSESRRIFDSWHRRRVRVRRNIAGFHGDRRSAYEILVSNAPHCVSEGPAI